VHQQSLCGLVLLKVSIYWLWR